MVPTILLASDDDDEAWKQLAAALTAAGDPRGELSSLQRSMAPPGKPTPATRKKVARLFESHGDRWLPPLGESSRASFDASQATALAPAEIDRSASFGVTWASGFWHTVKVPFPDETIAGRRQIDVVLDHPSAALLRDLQVRAAEAVGYDDVIERIAERPRLVASLREVSLSDTLLIGTSAGGRCHHLPRLLRLLPQLRSLSVDVFDVSLEALDEPLALPPQLRSLRLVAGAASAISRALAEARPSASVESLHLTAACFDRGASSRDEMTRLLSLEKWPALRHLTIERPDQRTIEPLVASGLVAHLESLALPRGALEGALAEELASCAGLDQLRLLDLRANFLSPTDAKRFRRRPFKLIDGGQRSLRDLKALRRYTPTAE